MPAVATKTYTLHSPCRNLKLIRRPLDDREMLDGRKIRVSEPVNYTFEPLGVLEIRDGQDVIEDYYPDTGETVTQDAISWLRRHPLLNQEYGFHVEGEEPDRPLPLETDFNRMVNEAIAALDLDAITALLDIERAGHNRPVLVASAENAQQIITSMKAAFAEQAAQSDAEQAQGEA